MTLPIASDKYEVWFPNDDQGNYQLMQTYSGPDAQTTAFVMVDGENAMYAGGIVLHAVLGPDLAWEYTGLAPRPNG